MPRDAISSKNVALENANFPFGIILNIVFISEYYDIKIGGLFFAFYGFSVAITDLEYKTSNILLVLRILNVSVAYIQAANRN